jgi:predicted DNA-binding transcriptional regulator YafY
MKHLKNLIKIVNYLTEERSASEMASFMNVDKRTIHRYIDTIHRSGFEILTIGCTRYRKYVLGKDRVPEFVKYLNR